MKLFLVLGLSGWMMGVQAKDVKDFNSELIRNVQKDIQNENDQQFKQRPAASRGPASVLPLEQVPDPKLERLRQIGPNKW